jgi:hypothetical protein
MVGFWMSLAAVSLTVVLAALHVKQRWASTSGAAALTGMSAVLVAFVVIGTLIEGGMHNAAWLMDDPGALWFGIFTAFGCFVLGALRAAPWLIAQIHAAEPDGSAPTAASSRA